MMDFHPHPFPRLEASLRSLRIRHTPMPVSRADRAREFLDNQILVEAYQDQLDRFVDGC